ncbi:hypothetical protein BKA18_006884 [Streptomyces auratus]
MGLRGVTRPDLHLRSLDSVVRLLLAGSNESEQKSRLTTLVASNGSYYASGSSNHVTLDLPETYRSAEERLSNGQLVCSLAHAQAILHPQAPSRRRPGHPPLPGRVPQGLRQQALDGTAPESPMGLVRHPTAAAPLLAAPQETPIVIALRDVTGGEYTSTNRCVSIFSSLHLQAPGSTAKRPNCKFP